MSQDVFDVFDVFDGEDITAVTPDLTGIEVHEDAEPADAGDQCLRGEA